MDEKNQIKSALVGPLDWGYGTITEISLKEKTVAETSLKHIRETYGSVSYAKKLTKTKTTKEPIKYSFSL